MAAADTRRSGVLGRGAVVAAGLRLAAAVAACLAATTGAAEQDAGEQAGRELVLGFTAAGRLVPLGRAPASPQGGVAGDIVHETVRVGRGDFPLEISIDGLARGGAPAVRICTRLEGLEGDWQDHESMMWLVLRFLDETDRAVSSASFTRTGASPGWTGLPQQSRFHRRVDEAVVPERARKMQLLLVSGGTPRTTGFWALRKLEITVAEAGESGPARRPLFILDRLTGTRLDSPRGNPAGWLRDGTGLRTPIVYTHARDEGDGSAMLALLDLDPANTGGWLQQVREAVAVAPGQRLRLESEEFHSIGRGGEAVAQYRTLPVGNYAFLARACDEYGRGVGATHRIPIEVQPPFHATAWFRWTMVVLGIAASAAAVRTWTRRNVQRELEKLERRRAVEEERTRLARDLHDEMGARLTQISLLATRALRAVPEANPGHEPVRQIGGAVRELASALDEIVWAANPVHDTIDGLANYISLYAGTVLGEAGLRCRLEIPPLLPARNLSSGSRHRLMMAVKEALNNALKHAQATEVRVALTLDDALLTLTIEDNGKGFDARTTGRGNGLENLRRRLAEAGGACEITSSPGRGTLVRLRLPAPAGEETA